MTKTVLVTGGTGFLGRHVVLQLLKCGARVRTLARSPSHSADGEIYVGNVNSPPPAAFADVDVVVHLAGLVAHTTDSASVREMFRTNVGGTESVMRAAAKAGVKLVIAASSSGVVACSRSATVMFDDNSPYCEDAVAGFPYYESKIEGEKLARKLADELNIQLIIVRPSLLLGPGDTRLSSTLLVKRFLQRAIPFTPTGNVAFVDVRDVSHVITQAALLTPACADDSHSNSTSFLVSTANVSLSDFFSQLQLLSQVPAPRFSAPAPIAYVGALLLTRLRALCSLPPDPAVDPVFAAMGACHWSVVDKVLLRATLHLDFRPRRPEVTLNDTIVYIKQQMRDDESKSSKSALTAQPTLLLSLFIMVCALAVYYFFT